MKQEIRLLGVDDGPFHFSDEKTVIIGVVMRASGYIEGILKKEISIDGNEATSIIVDMINHTRHKKQVKAMMLDGVALGGFNIVDIQKVFEETDLPVITVTRDKPNFESIKTALQSHFDDWEQRYELLLNGTLFEMETAYNPIFVKCAGISFEEAKEIITLATIRGVIPEPIRVAHIIASGILRGESYGKA
ncbi:MAG: DUF99 family protein [Candidatus Thermoplasmatota archaeon]|nr:DUF99 family protein [Candidatus Thermoplasmatota archaeon]